METVRPWRMELLTSLATKLPDAELDLLIAVAEGAVTGLTTYGPLRLSLPRRDQRNWRKEALEEIRDSIFYLGAALLRLQDPP